MVRMLRRGFLGVVYFFAVILVLFEEWLVELLKGLMAGIATLRAVAAFEAWVVTLSPTATMLVLMAPGALIMLALKLIEGLLLAGGHWLLMMFVFILAKVIGTAIFARLFVISREKMLSVRWFARAYGVWTRWSAWAHKVVRESAMWRRAQELKAAIREWKARHKNDAWSRRFRAMKEAARRKWRFV